MPDPDWVIEAEDLALGYTDSLILDGISVRFQAGEITCIIGGSGCGKSTLTRGIIGLLRPRRGEVRLLGHDPYALKEEERSAMLSNIGYMFQYGALLASISVAENLSIPMRAHTDVTPDVIDRTVALKLGIVGLAHAQHKLPGELSGGMRKRVGLARAIMLDPPIVICDEPSAGLDPITAANLDQLILRLKELYGMTVIVVTHELASILTIADRIVMLADKKKRFDGPLAEARASKDPLLVGFFGRQHEEAQDRGRTLYDCMRRESVA